MQYTVIISVRSENRTKAQKHTVWAGDTILNVTPDDKYSNHWGLKG